MQAGEKNKASIFFSTTSWYKHFFEYLNVAELLTLAATNREAYKVVGNLMKEKLVNEGVQVPQDYEDYIKLYKETHLRSVIILPLSSLNSKDKIDVFSNSKISKKTLFVDRIISDFAFGIKFVCYYFPNKDLILLTKSNFLVLPRQQLAKETNQRLVKNVIKFGIEARHATFLDSDSNLRAILYKKDKESEIEGMPELPIDRDVVDFAMNYNFLVYQTKSGDFFLISKYSNINLGQSVKYKISMPVDTYSLFLSGINFYLKDSKEKFYYISLKDIDPIAIDGNNEVKVLTMSEFSFMDKSIQTIFTGLRNEMLMINNEYKRSEDWTNEEVRNWFRSIGVSGIDGILKYDKFTGEQLNTIDTQMMVERFGIKNTAVHDKICSEIGIEMRKKNHEAEMYGMGYNSDGQLCINDSHKTVSYMTKIKLPELSNYDDIQEIQFGWTNTLIITKEGRIFLSYKRQKKKQDEEEKVEEDLRMVRNKLSRKISGNIVRKVSEAIPESPVDSKLKLKRKSSKRYDQEDISLSSESEENTDMNLPYKQRKKKKQNVENSKNSRGIKKERRKTSFATNDSRKDEEEGVAKWLEITNLFIVNK